MKKRTIEIQFGSHILGETFISWLEDSGIELFEDWVLNFTSIEGGIEIDTEDVDDGVIRIDEV